MTRQKYGTNLRVYDNGGKSFDRYTIIPPRWAKDYRENGFSWSAIAASENPFHPQGFGMHVTAIPGSHLGKRIKWRDLPDMVKGFAKNSFPEYT